MKGHLIRNIKSSINKNSPNNKIILNTTNIDYYKSNLAEELKPLISLISITNNTEIIINSNPDKSYNLKLLAFDYKHILDNYLLKTEKYYDLKLNKIEDIIKDINFYNNLIKISKLNDATKISNPDLFTIKKYFPKSKETILIILATNTNRKIIIKGLNPVIFTIDNISYFDKLILPELLNLYIQNNNHIDKDNLIKQYSKSFYQANDNLYLINFDEPFLEANIKYLEKIISQKNYQLHINENYIKEENSQKRTKYRPNYSYGYVNILLIAFILSLLTIIICLTKY